MRDLDFIDEDSPQTVFRDVIMLALLGFVTLVLLMLPHLNPEAVAEEAARSPGNVFVEIRWPDETDADVDLWVQGPGDRPVGYSNKAGGLFNLLRDDLGHRVDVTGLNYESTYSRGVVAGEYTINVHLFQNPTRTYPIEVAVGVSVKRAADKPMRQILATRVSLTHAGQETTAFRFELDDAGRLVSGSVHDLPRALRSAKPPA